MKNIIMITLVSSLVLSSTSFAGTVKLVSNTWDNICKVQVTTGSKSPNSYISTYKNVRKNSGWSKSGSNRLCYRRSGNPSNCNSSYTDWTCDTKNTSGTSILNIN